MVNQPCILVCDDDPLIRKVIKANLIKRNYQVSEFENGQQLIDYLQNDTGDLIILDLGMPIMNGFDTCVWIRQHDIDTPIIVLTAYEDFDLKYRAISLGVDDYMHKPFQIQDFLARIERAIK